MADGRRAAAFLASDDAAWGAWLAAALAIVKCALDGLVVRDQTMQGLAHRAARDCLSLLNLCNRRAAERPAQGPHARRL